MKADLIDVNDTRKDLKVEIPSDVVDAHIDQIARDYSRKARIPGFRPGKAPAHVIKQRFREQILHDVAHDLIPRALDDALRERGVEALDTPDVRDVTIEAGQAMTFTASFDTLPPFDLGDYASIVITPASRGIDDAAVDAALERLRERSARFDPVEGRGIVEGDTLTLDIARSAGDEAPTRHENAVVELGAKGNPPGFDEQLLGLEPGAEKRFQVRYPADYAVAEMADTEATFDVTVKAVRRKVLPALDDELAKDLGDFDTLDALRARVREDLEHEARHAAEQEMRNSLLKQLAAQLSFEVPASLVEREVDRRLEEFARRLIDQKIDPRQAGIDWDAFRESQRGAAREAVGSTIALDAVARREHLEVGADEIDQEIARYAERSGRTAAAVRAALEKEGGLSRVAAGLRREKSIDFVRSRARMAGE